MEVNETKLKIPYAFWILLLCGAMLFYADVFQIQLYPPNEILLRNNNSNKNYLAGFVINTPGCRIPDMNPFSDGVKKYIKEPTPSNCNNGIPPLFESNDTSLYLLNSSLASYNIIDVNDLKCCYRTIWRKEPKEGEYDNKMEYSTNCYDFSESVDIREEFVKVICVHDNRTIYKDMFSFVPVKHFSKGTVDDTGLMNILVIGLDSVSRLNLHRQMPKTVDYLKQIGVVEMLGYNKVGDNTFPNLIPVLTGMSEEELTKSCWPSSKHYFDNCSFVWKEYKKKNYVTVYGEDSSWMGLFNYQRRGFRKQTVDYAYNYFNRWSENEIGNSHEINVEECEGGRLIYIDLLEYVKKIQRTMERNKLPYFGFFWSSSLSHDYLNKPKLGDEAYKTFFKTIKEEGYLKNTLLIFMSDHGIRWGGIRQTFQGMMEERLPFVMMVLPDGFENQYQRAYHNLKRNTRRLTSPFDLHETLVDLINPSDMKDEYLEGVDQSRGVSFFRQISKDRTCEDVGISSHWCTCQQSIEIENNASVVIESALFAVDDMNSRLKGYAQCATLTLDAVLNTRLMTHGSAIRGKNKIQDYIITLRTLPGEGIFEVTVRKLEKLKKFAIMGTVSRLNLYGKQSSCITDFHLKLYCYCKSLVGA
nr:uncharacterized protein LOC111509955 isoform X1 [Leptinotarsa decemlineata]